MMIATKMPFFVLASHLRSSSNNKMTGWISRRKKRKGGNPPPGWLAPTRKGALPLSDFLHFIPALKQHVFLRKGAKESSSFLRTRSSVVCYYFYLGGWLCSTYCSVKGF